MKNKNVLKNAFVNLALRVLAKALLLSGGSKEGRDFSFSLGVEGVDSVCFEHRNGALSRADEAGLSISFKNVDCAIKTFLMRVAPREAYAKNYFIVRGDYADALTVVDILERAEANLLPKRAAKKLLGRTAKTKKTAFYGAFAFKRIKK